MRLRKLLSASYLVGLHLAILVLMIETDFARKFQARFLENSAISNPHGRVMIRYHNAMDASVPADATIFLGDSITQGLATAAVAPYSVNYGIGSATTSELLANLKNYKSLERASSIFLMIGINDIGNGMTEGLDERLHAISSTIPRGRSLVWSGIMPSYSEQHSLEKIEMANKMIQTICSERKECIYIDTREVFASDRSLFSDGVHPNDAGYARWIDALRTAHQQLSVQKPSPSR